MKHLAAAAAAVFIALPWLPAQEGSGQKEREEEIQRRILEQRRQPQEQTVQANAQVVVRLRNDESIRGVVKGGRFVEKPDGLVFSELERRTRGAGIRVWYYDGTNSFVFLPWEQIAVCSVLRRLSDEELREIAKRMEEEARARRERTEEADARRMERLREVREGRGREAELGRRLEELVREEEAAEEARKLQTRRRALLTEFPSEEGWGPARLREIHLRRVAIGAFPDERSRRFVEVFEEWREAFDAREQEAARQKEKEKEPRPAPDAGRSPDQGRGAGRTGRDPGTGTETERPRTGGEPEKDRRPAPGGR